MVGCCLDWRSPRSRRARWCWRSAVPPFRWLGTTSSSREGAMLAAVAHSPHMAGSPIGALAQLLEDLGAVVANLSSEAYCAPFERGVSGTIGEHVRHCLDHVAALLAADPAMVLTYDRRQRGTPI